MLLMSMQLLLHVNVYVNEELVAWKQSVGINKTAKRLCAYFTVPNKKWFFFNESYERYENWKLNLQGYLWIHIAGRIRFTDYDHTNQSRGQYKYLLYVIKHMNLIKISNQH